MIRWCASLALVLGVASATTFTETAFASTSANAFAHAGSLERGTTMPVAPLSKRKALPTYVVTTSDIGGLGVVLVDGKGQTLYVFGPDRHSNTSRCTSECAIEWPPLLLPAGVKRPVAAGRAKTSLLSTTRRSDGTLQVTYDGWPLYRFATDESPGAAPGEGLNNLGGRWFVLGPSGVEIR